MAYEPDPRIKTLRDFTRIAPLTANPFVTLAHVLIELLASFDARIAALEAKRGRPPAASLIGEHIDD